MLLCPPFFWHEIMNKPSVTPDQILEIIETACTSAGMEPPKTLRADFQEHLGDMPNIDHFKRMNRELCARISKKFSQDEKLKEQYGDIMSTIRNTVRLQ